MYITNEIIIAAAINLMNVKMAMIKLKQIPSISDDSDKLAVVYKIRRVKDSNLQTLFRVKRFSRPRRAPIR